MRALLVLLLVGCSGKNSDSGTPPGSIAGATSGTPGGTTGTTLPADPRPLEIVFSGALNETIVFDAPTCTNYPENILTNFRMFWRGQHNAVLIAEVLGDFTGAGSYDTLHNNLRVKLQTEAGSTYTFDAFDVQPAQGDVAAMIVDHISDIAYGTFDFSGMHDATGGTLTASPSTIPIWCEAVEN